MSSFLGTHYSPERNTRDWKQWFLLQRGIVKVKFVQLCLTLFDPIDYIVHGILQARILEQVAIPFSRGSSWPRDRTWVSCIAGRFFTIWATREAHLVLWKWKVKVKVAQSYPTLCNPMDYIVHGILQARILEWVAFLSLGYLLHPGIELRSSAWQVDSSPAEPQGKPM